MSELRRHYKVETPPEPIHYAHMTRAAVRRRSSGGSGGLLYKTDDAPPTPTSPTASAEMSYDLKEDEAVSMAQTERIVQRMRNKK